MSFDTLKSSGRFPRIIVSTLPVEREALGYAAVLALYVLPIWLVSYFPTHDGPVHASIGVFMAHYGDPDYGAFSRYLRINGNIEPNLAVYALFGALIPKFSAITAEKIVVTTYVLLLAAGARYALGGIDRRMTWLAWLFLPFTYGFYLHMGFYNFSLGTAAFLFGFGVWLRFKEHWTWGRAIGFACLGVAVVLTHLMALAVLCLVIGIMSLHAVVIDVKEGWPRPHIWQGFIKRALVPAGALLPSLMIVVAFFLRNGVVGDPTVAHGENLLGRLARLVGMAVIVTFNKWEYVAAIPFALLLVALTVHLLRQRWRENRLPPGDAFLAALVGLTVIYFVMPPMATRDVSAAKRLWPFIFFMLIMWFATNAIGRHLRRRVIAAAAAVSLLLLGVRMVTYLRLAPYIEEYLSMGEAMEPNSTVLPLHLWKLEIPLDGHDLTWRADPFRHLSAYFAERKVVTLSNAPMAPSMFGYFPMVYRSGFDAYSHIGRTLEEEAGEARFLDYERLTGGRVDYVLTWGETPESRADPNNQALWDQLAAGYELIKVSQGHGMARLYRLKKHAG